MVYHRKRLEPEEVEFYKSDKLDHCFVILRDAVIFLIDKYRGILVNRLLADDKSACVLARLTQKSFNFDRNIDDFREIGIVADNLSFICKSVNRSIESLYILGICRSYPQSFNRLPQLVRIRRGIIRNMIVIFKFCRNVLCFFQILRRKHIGKRIRNKFRQLVRCCKGNVKSSRDIAYCRLCLELTESGNLGNIRRAVFLRNVLDYPLAVVLTEIDIKIRHRNSLGIEESFKKKLVTERVEIGDSRAVGNKRACTAATPRTYRNTVVFRPADEVRDYEEIAGEIHSDDNTELVIEPFPVSLFLFLRCSEFNKTLLEPFFRHIAEEFCRTFVTSIENRKIVVPQIKFDIAPFGDFNGIFYSFRSSLAVNAEKFAHLSLAFEVKCRGLVVHSVGIGNFFLFVYAEKYVLRLGILRIQIVDIVRRDKTDSELAGQFDELRVYLFLFLYSVHLKFDKEIVFAEKFDVFKGYPFCIIVSSGNKFTRNLAAEARACGNDSL